MAGDPTDGEDSLSRVAITRRSLLGAAAVALIPSDTSSYAEDRYALATASLKEAASFPVGAAVATARFDDAPYMAGFLKQFSQITPEWEMKMGPMLGGDGTLRPGAADRLVAYARAHDLAVHGTTLVWHKNPPAFFSRMAARQAAFRAAYIHYIRKVTGRYRGDVRGWDVVNEPLDDDGALRPSLWARTLGQEAHIAIAFAAARAGDRSAVLFLNEYDLEKRPDKRRAYLRLAERLMRQDVPLGGLGTQCHLRIDQDPAALRQSIADLASLGLPIHVSELDISTAAGRFDLRGDAKKMELQARTASILADAFMALPSKQRYAFTLWGMRDNDSWLVKPPMAGIRGGTERPLAFDSAGRAKPMAVALARRFAAG